VNHQATDLGVVGRPVPARCRLNDARANNILGRPVQDVEQSTLACRLPENMRRTIEKCPFIQGLDEGEREPVFGLLRQSDFNPVLIPDD
jgi:hypothetical protein